MSVGTQVRRLRQEQGITQAALAARVGVHQAHLANIENGVKVPSLKTLLALSAALAVSLDTLVGNPSVEPIPEPI